VNIGLFIRDPLSPDLSLTSDNFDIYECMGKRAKMTAMCYWLLFLFVTTEVHAKLFQFSTNNRAKNMTEFNNKIK